MKNILTKLGEKKDLTAEETHAFLSEVMTGTVSPIQTAAILTALRMKGETVEEILGFIHAMREQMIAVIAPDGIDVCGTGGDGSNSFNISTTVAFVVAGAGVTVAKHGNRAASSNCGSADVLEALGVTLGLTAEQATAVYKKVGMVFLLAPLFHPSLKHVATVRKELGIRTIFNFLGPFASPASVKKQLIGVPSVAVAKKLIEVAKKLEYDHLLIVSSKDGMDEISLFAKTQGYSLVNGKLKHFVIDPSEYGFKHASREEILGGTVEDNAKSIRDILGGKKGVKRDIVVLNAAYALLVAGKVTSVQEGIKQAEKSLDSGAAKSILENLIKETKRYA